MSDTVPGLEHLPPLQSGRSAKSRNPAIADRRDAPLVPAAKAPGQPVRSCDERERLFAEHWVVHRNATQAYKHGYNPDASYEGARSMGHEVFHRPQVQAEIAALLDAQRNNSAAVADVGWLLRRFVDIATADPRELIGLKVGCCRYCHGDGNLYQWREREYLEALDKAEHEAANLPTMLGRQVRFPDVAGGFGFNATKPPNPDCPECHGEGLERFVPRDTDLLSDQALLLYGGVKAKRDGYEIIIADQQKALEMAGRIMGAFTDRVQVDGTVKSLIAVADLAKMDPQEASRKYQDFIRGRLAANRPDPRTKAGVYVDDV